MSGVMRHAVNAIVPNPVAVSREAEACIANTEKEKLKMSWKADESI